MAYVEQSPAAGNDPGQNLALASTAAAAFASSNATVNLVIVNAPIANTLPVYVGLSSSVTTSTGIELNPGDSVTLPVNNASRIYCVTAYVATTQNVRALAL